MQFLAQTPPAENFWGKEPGTHVWIALAVVLVIGFALVLLLMRTPTRLRKWVIGFFTFIAGFFFVFKYLWPEPINRGENDIPANAVEKVGFLIIDATPQVASIAQVVTVFLLGLGIFSLVRIHVVKLAKKQQDWVFSLLLLVSLVVMVIVGYWDWTIKQFHDPQGQLADPANWTFVNYASDMLFDGLIQQMDAAMFSMIAFFILSAAYRAFRIRSIESTVMMASALIMIISLMGYVDFMWNNGIDAMISEGGEVDLNHWANNLRLTEISSWVKSYMQIPSLRALDFGVGLGALAMGLRIWLGLEKGGLSA